MVLQGASQRAGLRTTEADILAYMHDHSCSQIQLSKQQGPGEFRLFGFCLGGTRVRKMVWYWS